MRRRTCFEFIHEGFCLSPFNSLLIPYKRPTYSPSIPYLFRTNVGLISPSSIYYLSSPYMLLTPYNPPTYLSTDLGLILPSICYLPHTNVRLTLHRFVTYPIQTSVLPLLKHATYPVQTSVLPRTTVRLTPLQTCYLPRTTVRLNPRSYPIQAYDLPLFKHLTYLIQMSDLSLFNS